MYIIYATHDQKGLLSNDKQVQHIDPGNTSTDLFNPQHGQVHEWSSPFSSFIEDIESCRIIRIWLLRLPIRHEDYRPAFLGLHLAASPFLCFPFTFPFWSNLTYKSQSFLQLLGESLSWSWSQIGFEVEAIFVDMIACVMMWYVLAIKVYEFKVLIIASIVVVFVHQFWIGGDLIFSTCSLKALRVLIKETLLFFMKIRFVIQSCWI